MNIQSLSSHPQADGKLGEVCDPQNISEASQQNVNDSRRWGLLKHKKHPSKKSNLAPHSASGLIQVLGSPKLCGQACAPNSDGYALKPNAFCGYSEYLTRQNVSNIFSNQFEILGLPDTWITLYKLYGVILYFFVRGFFFFTI